jgi:hypothetical protein
MLNPQFHSVDHDVRIIVDLSLKIRESIVGWQKNSLICI